MPTPLSLKRKWGAFSFYLIELDWILAIIQLKRETVKIAKMSMIAIVMGVLLGCGGSSSDSEPATLPNLLSESVWEKSDWDNGVRFSSRFCPDNVLVTSSTSFELSVTDSGCGLYNTNISGEYRSGKFYGYGVYSAEIKPSMKEGVVSSFFMYTGSSDGGNIHNEIDFEFVGNNTFQTNVWYDGVEHPEKVTLAFDPTQAFHKYTIKWEPLSVQWLVDDTLVRTAYASSGLIIPNTPMKVYTNIWTCDASISSWCGVYTFDADLSISYRNINGAEK